MEALNHCGIEFCCDPDQHSTEDPDLRSTVTLMHQ